MRRAKRKRDCETGEEVGHCHGRNNVLGGNSNCTNYVGNSLSAIAISSLCRWREIIRLYTYLPAMSGGTGIDNLGGNNSNTLSLT